MLDALQWFHFLLEGFFQQVSPTLCTLNLNYSCAASRATSYSQYFLLLNYFQALLEQLTHSPEVKL